ncbi:alpha-L-fucosidase [Pedobacter sp. WC2501]|uniref:alpha-L-fucosidase n=1 Tax=Pedobacter sp. WC2501 TaxID=3461400 RepID=UPI004045C8BC
MKKKIFLSIITISMLLNAQAQQKTTTTEQGKFSPTDESLQEYKYPDWFRDAKFGIWSHWGPQAVPRQGDWYAKNMYLQGNNQNKYHVEHYGTPSKFGYKDIIPLWKAEKWNPEQLMALYKKAGAKYFVSMGSHHDMFFLWNSKIHKWNSVNMGPHKDVVGLWQKAAKKEGLRFGVSEHLAASFNWFQPSHGSDTTGQFAGVPYDGRDPKYSDLYHLPADSSDIKEWLTNNPAWHKKWLEYVTELIDLYHPDLLYSDSKVPFEEYGRKMVAHYYNQDMAKNKGKLEAVYTPKEASGGKWAQDVERGVLDSISPFPWQTDTSIGDWYYRTGQRYKSANGIAQLLIDVVSKNGNLLINVVQTPEGDLEPDVIKIVTEIGEWTKTYGEGIYATRPWKVYGEGPSTIKSNQKKGVFGGLTDTGEYEATDIRYTTKGRDLFAFCLAVPKTDIKMELLGKNSKYLDKPISSVTLLGSKEKLDWTQTDGSLVIKKPKNYPTWAVTGYKIEFKK